MRFSALIVLLLLTAVGSARAQDTPTPDEEDTANTEETPATEGETAEEAFDRDEETFDRDEEGVVNLEVERVEGEIDTPEAVYVLTPSQVDPGALPEYSPVDEPDAHPRRLP